MTPKAKKKIDDILAEVPKQLKKSTLPDDPVSKLMASNIKEFDTDSQFDITNQRMLAVRDDLTYIVNTRTAGIGTDIQHYHAQVIRAFADLDLRIYKLHVEQVKALHDLLFALEERLARIEMPWWRKAWLRIKAVVGTA